jgi:hypothetical protein
MSSSGHGSSYQVKDCSGEDAAAARHAARPHRGVVSCELGFAREAGMALGTGNVESEPPPPSGWVPLQLAASPVPQIDCLGREGQSDIQTAARPPKRGDHLHASVVDVSVRPEMQHLAMPIELPQAWAEPIESIEAYTPHPVILYT